MRCPVCRDEYETGVTTCADCDVALVPADAPVQPRVDSHLGTFHPAVAAQVSSLLDHRRIAFDEVPAGEDRIAVVVDREWRDELRAELVVTWSDLVGRLPEEEMYDVLGAGGAQPGWYDAPRGAWIDRAGRLQVDPTEDEQIAADQRRLLGPALVAAGVVLLLLGWYGTGATTRALAGLLGVLLIVGGLLVPR